jgi:hypothetical protein
MFATGDLLRSVIKDQLSSQIVYPNKVYIKLKDIVEANVMPKISRVIRISFESIEAIESLDGNTINTAAKLGSQNFQLPEVEIKEGSGQFLNFECDFIYFANGEKDLEIVVDAKNKDETITSLTGAIDVESLTKEKFSFKNQLRPLGSITTSVVPLTLSSNRKDFKLEYNKSSALLQVFIESPQKLPTKKKNVFVKLAIENQFQETLALNEETNSWKKLFTFLLHDPKSDSLKIELVDQLSAEMFANFTYKISELMDRKDMHHKLQAFPFSGSEKCEILMSLKLYLLNK